MRPVENPPSPYTSKWIEWIDAPEVKLSVYEERARSIISANDSPDIGFSHSINPYRGCFHGCAYCYARPTHQHLDLGAGTDFERKLIAKINAPELLEAEFKKKSWNGDTIFFSGVTDCYQPLELTYEITRRCLEICSRYRNPVAIITKSAIITRDIDILQELNRSARLSVYISLAFSDNAMARDLEPYAPSPSTRLRAIEALAKAGIKVGIGLAPVIPGINDSQISEIIRRAADHGATSAFMTLLRLPAEVKDIFLTQLKAHFPDRYQKVVNQLCDLKGGALNISRFSDRMRGSGPRWEAIRFLFQSACREYGMNRERREHEEANASTFRRPTPQLGLFE